MLAKFTRYSPRHLPTKPASGLFPLPHVQTRRKSATSTAWPATPTDESNQLQEPKRKPKRVKLANESKWYNRLLLKYSMRATQKLGIMKPMLDYTAVNYNRRSTQPALAQYRAHTFSARDVIVTSAMKSGTNLTLQLAQQLAWLGYVLNACLCLQVPPLSV